MSFTHNYPVSEHVTVKFVEPNSELYYKGVRVGQRLKAVNLGTVDGSRPVRGSDTSALEQSRHAEKVY